MKRLPRARDVLAAVEELRRATWSLRVDLEEGRHERSETLWRVEQIEEGLERLRDRLRESAE